MTIRNELSADTIKLETTSEKKLEKLIKKATTRQQIEDYIEARRLRENLDDVFTHLLEVDKQELEGELARWLD